MDTQPMGLAVITGASLENAAINATRQALLPNLSRREPRARYAVVRKAG
jgi:hypothetical protein